MPATRRSDATQRPRVGCPPPSAAGLIMTVRHEVHGQNELCCPGFLASGSPPGQEERLVTSAGDAVKSGSTPWVVGACGTRAQPPAEASCGRLVRREASACAWLVVRLTCRARGASEAAPRTLGPCVMVGGAGGPPAEVRPWWWPERVSRVGARLRMPLEDSLASGRPRCLLYTSPSPRDGLLSRMPSSA